jgi:hypothetical protein
MSGSLTRVNFWGAAIPHEVHRSAQRVLVSNGLLDPSKVTTNHGNNLASCNCGGDCNTHCGGCNGD